MMAARIRAEVEAAAASALVGRQDVTAVIERAIDALPMATRMYPDIYAHEVTAALIAAGFIATGEAAANAHADRLAALADLTRQSQDATGGYR